MTVNGHFALNSVLRRYVWWSSEAWLSKLDYYTLKVVVNVVGETEKNSCGIARFLC